MRSPTGTIRLALCFSLLLAALTLVIWRQSDVLATLRELDKLRDDRALAEAERSALLREIERLESRPVVAAAARSRLGMRVPQAHEMIFLPIGPEAPAATRSGKANIAMSAVRP